MEKETVCLVTTMLHFPRTYEIRKFEQCLREKFGDSADDLNNYSPSGDLPYDLSVKNEVTEQQLLKMFKYQREIVEKIEDCLPELGFIVVKDGVFRKRTPEELYADFKCTTMWYQRQHEELKGKVVKVKELDPDLLMCMKKFGHYEQVDDETIRVI